MTKHREPDISPTLQDRLVWTEQDQERSARWRSENGSPAPRRLVCADDRMTADAAFRLASEGTALLWRGDFQNARQLLQAMARRTDRPRESGKGAVSTDPTQAFHLHRQAQAQRARTLGMLLIPFDANHSIPLRRAPDVRQACVEAYGDAGEPYVASLRELLGVIGGHEWHKKGVEVAAAGGRIHPCYGVFSPVRGEYLRLVAETPLPPGVLRGAARAFDVGTGTGVLAAVLARRGIGQIVATDLDRRALACARANIERLALTDRVEVREADLFPDATASLVVCNPPWLPARPASTIEQAIYDPDSRMLRGFLDGLAAHLEPDGEGWLILSDLAERLGLRSRAALLEWIGNAGLVVAGREDARPVHPKAFDPADPLHAARAGEITSLWRLRQAAA